ncbi:hypothetical protein N0V84_012115 [Fusarium piperis]|uniref:Cytochrome P450 n=1 Tax=Fusarium piperis TaxID=1435070 RepID=A0A9W8W036_9HYPO|nr:hypothetical protein N0V84_012115 [Fusarium piperis]
MALRIAIDSTRDALSPAVRGIISPLTGLTLLAIALVILRPLFSSSSKNPPPGPPGWPVLGNILDIVSAAKAKRLHYLFEEWANKYGDVMLIRSGVEDEYYVNTRPAVRAIMDTNTATTSERPRWIVSNEHICGQWNLLYLPSSHPRWKEQRRITNQNLTSPTKAELAVPYLEFEALKFMHEVAHDPNGGTDKQDLWNQMGRYIYSTFTTQLFGLEVCSPATPPAVQVSRLKQSQIKSTDSPVIPYLFDTGVAQIAAINPGAELVDSFPILDYLPDFLRRSQVKGDIRFKRDVKWAVARLNHLKRLKAEGRSPDCFLGRILDDEKLGGCSSLEEAAYLALTLVLGGSDTSRMTSWAFMEMMLMNMDEFTKLQKIIDDHCGDRLPVWKDIDNIPHVRYVMKETWRIRPPVSLGMLAHTTTKDIEYNGYHIPKGARLKLNSWALGHDPNFYNDPKTFRPERHQGDLRSSQESANLTDVNARDHFAFGIGRRTCESGPFFKPGPHPEKADNLCPGLNVADRAFAIAIMRLAWAFDIKPAPRAKLPINSDDFPHYIPGIAGEDMPINMVPRSQERLELIDKYYAEALASRLDFVWPRKHPVARWTWMTDQHVRANREEE